MQKPKLKMSGSKDLEREFVEGIQHYTLNEMIPLPQNE